MKKMTTLLSLTLVVSVLVATSALALPANYAYTVKLSAVSDSGQKTVVEQLETMTDASGKLSFQFGNVPDTDTAPFLLVEVIDTSGDPFQIMRQSLVPAPSPGQAMQMGVNETSHRQTQAALRAFSDGEVADPFRAMFPLAMISGGAINDADADSLGQVAGDASLAFESYLTQAGVGAEQLATFSTGLMAAMRWLAAHRKVAVDEVDPVVAAAHQGQADGEFMRALIEAGANAGIDPEVIAAAFDQARVAMDNAPGTLALSPGGFAMLDATFTAGGLQRRVQARMQHYEDAMGLLNADPEQLQAFTAARAALHEAMIQARQDFQQLFSDPDNLPDQMLIDQARADFETAMQEAVAVFRQATTASDPEIDAMLERLAARMGGAMPGGSMLIGASLEGMGFGRLQTAPGGASQNWSTMMIAASSLAATVPELNYQPVTIELTTELEQLQPTPDLPAVPDWSALPDDANRSLLHLQYDLMLVELIDRQAMENLTMPLTASDQAQVSDHHLANLAAVRQGLQGLTDAQKHALVAAMSPLQRL